MGGYQHCLLTSSAGKVCLFYLYFLRSVVPTFTTWIIIIQRTLFICLMKSLLKVPFKLPKSYELPSFVANHTSTNTVRSTVKSVGESQRRSDRRCFFDVQYLRNIMSTCTRHLQYPSGNITPSSTRSHRHKHIYRVHVKLFDSLLQRITALIYVSKYKGTSVKALLIQTRERTILNGCFGVYPS